MKNVIRAIKVICLINIICCLPLVIRNREVLNVDSSNRTVIQQNLEKNHIESTELIKKLSISREFNDYVLRIHYWYGKVDSEVLDGGFNTNEEWEKVWENSYQERDRGLVVGGTSLVILIILRKLKKKWVRSKRCFIVLY